MVTSQTGEILRANRAAVLFLDAPEPIIHKPLDLVLGAQSVDVSIAILRHERTVLCLYALQHHNC